MRHQLPKNALFHITTLYVLPFLNMELSLGVLLMMYTSSQSLLCKKSCKGYCRRKLLLCSIFYFSSSVLLKLQDLFELTLSSFVYGSVNRISPSCFHGFLNLLSNVHEHHTRQASRIDIFLTRKFTLQYGLKSVRYACVKSWNSISIQIQQAFSIKAFRRQVKLYLLSINNQSKSLENVYLTTSLFK